MDLVLALSTEWNDTRLMWKENNFGRFPVKAIQVNSEDIWTPNIDLANRIHNYSPNTERYLKTTVEHNGKVRQYRLFRAHVNFGTDSMLYPYDSQMPSLKLQSLDHGKNEVILNTKTLNNLNKLNPGQLNVSDVRDVSYVQERFLHLNFYTILVSIRY